MLTRACREPRGGSFALSRHDVTVADEHAGRRERRRALLRESNTCGPRPRGYCSTDRPSEDAHRGARPSSARARPRIAVPARQGHGEVSVWWIKGPIGHIDRRAGHLRRPRLAVERTDGHRSRGSDVQVRRIRDATERPPRATPARAKHATALVSAIDRRIACASVHRSNRRAVPRDAAPQARRPFTRRFHRPIGAPAALGPLPPPTG